MRTRSYFISIFLFPLLTIFLFSCTTVLNNPYDKSNTTVTFLAKSSTNIIDDYSIEDSVGNVFSIGFFSNLLMNLDSVQFTLAGSATDSVVKVFKDIKSRNINDTLWDSMSFTDIGTKTIKGIAYVTNYKTISDSLKIMIIPKPLNHKPHLTVNGQRSILSGQTCLLTLSIDDTDNNQKDTVILLKKPSGSSIIGNLFSWTAPSDFIGYDTIIFMSRDNGYPPMFDTQNVIIGVSVQNKPPKWQKNTINEVGRPGVPIAITLSDKCADPDNDVLMYLLVSGVPDGDSIANASSNPTYTFTPGPADTGVFYVRIVAKDPKDASDTLTLTLNIHALSVLDTIPPFITLLSPSENSSISSSAYPITIRCTDPSGVASVRCSIGNDTFPVSHTDSIYTAIASGLKQGLFTTVSFIAIDASSRTNRDTFYVHVKYDSTMADNAGPIIIKRSGPVTNARTANPNDTLVYAITDQSGIDSVYWTLNKGASIVLTPEANGQYSIKAVLSSYRTNTIIITATDKSPAHNKSGDTTVLDYNVAPKANDQNLSTKKNTVLSITLTADPIDGDTLSGWVVVAPPTNGDLSGAAPALTYTPKTGFLGSDSLSFTVSDGKNTSNTAKVKINVSDVLVAPVAGKTIADIVVNKGQAAAFVATVNVDANPSPAFSWFKDGGSTSLSANQTYTIAQTSYSDQGRYRYLVSNSQGKDTSNLIALTVKDITKPVIVLKGANPQLIPVGVTYSELGDSAYDDKDGVITSKVVIDISKVKIAQIGTYPVTYAVKDSASNIADTVTRSVQIFGNAPAITKFSGNKETCINVPAIFSVSATGSQPIKYQWMKGTAAAPGTSTDSAYTITPLSTADAGSFYCVVSNGISPDAQSQNMTLSVDSPPAITGIAATPSAMPICAGTQVVFTVTATGTAPFTYTWKKNGVAITNASNNATYTITAVAVSDSGQYSCTVSNGCNPAATSANVQLLIKMPPMISTPAANATISKIVGDTVTLTVAASGTGTLTYQWYKGSAMVGTNSSAFPIKPVALTDSGAYTCVVSNGCGNVTSKVITVTVGSRPSITTQPLSQTLYLGQSTTFSVVAVSIPQPTYQWRKNGTAIYNATNASYTISSPDVSDSGKYTVTVINSTGSVTSDTARFYAGIKSMAAGWSHSLILKTDGRIWACGYNSYGQLGDGTTTDHSTPVQVMSNVQSMAAGNGFSLILKRDGILWGCGHNNSGQLGNGTTIDYSIPVLIMGSVQSMSAGSEYCLILKSNGTLWACGNNEYGQLGDGTTTNRSSPIQVMSNVQNMVAGGRHSLIFKTDGTLWICGNNIAGQLGDGTNNSYSTPIQVTGISNLQRMTAGWAHTFIQKSDSTLWACGWNFDGQLGDGTTTDHSSPVQVMSNARYTAAGYGHSLILKNNGTLWACGWNYAGQLGDGTTTDRYEPVRVMNNVQSIAAGNSYSLILLTDGILEACGDNTFGQLGDGTTTNRSSPVNISF